MTFCKLSGRSDGEQLYNKLLAGSVPTIRCLRAPFWYVDLSR